MTKNDCNNIIYKHKIPFQHIISKMFKLICAHSIFILFECNPSVLVIKMLSKWIYELVTFKIVVITTYYKIFSLYIILFYFRQCLIKHRFIVCTNIHSFLKVYFYNVQIKHIILNLIFKIKLKPQTKIYQIFCIAVFSNRLIYVRIMNHK